MLDRTLYTYSILKEMLFNHAILKGKSLKKLNIHYPGIYIEVSKNEIIEEVEWSEFLKDEPDRIPLLVANRAHLWPKAVPFDIFFEQERTVALLHVFYLSGYVKGCEVYQLPASFNYLVDFPKDYERFKLLK